MFSFTKFALFTIAVWRDLGSNLRNELNRYHHVIWLESSAALGFYDGSESNFCRFEDAKSAIESGEMLKQLWSGHPKLQLVSALPVLEDKIAAVSAAIAPLV